jgi:hypothetical protein
MKISVDRAEGGGRPDVCLRRPVLQRARTAARRKGIVMSERHGWSNARGPAGTHAGRSASPNALHALWSLRYSGIRPLPATCMQRLNTAHAELNGPINAAFLCPCVHVLKLRDSRFSVSVGTSTVAGHACEQKAHWPRRCWDKGPRRRASHVDQRFARERALLLTLETSTQNDRLIGLSYSLHLQIFITF